MHPLFVVLVLTTISLISTDPIIIRSGLNKDQAHHDDENHFDHSSIKGIANYEGEEGFNHDNESKFVKAQDSGKYNQENSDKKLHSDEKNFSDDKFHQQAGGAVSDFGKKSANKKGHHKSGYSKSYHKDESGSSSSYYDDSDDEGGEYVHNTRKNSFGDAGQHSLRGAHLDDSKYVQDQDKNGYYNTAGNYEKGLANNRDYHGKRYYDNKENEARRNLANQHGEAGHYEEEKFVKKPYYHHAEPYYDQPYYHHAPKKTITIYEDPRYINDGYEQYPHYDNDYIQLDIKRPTRDYDYNRYYEPKPAYDYYY